MAKEFFIWQLWVKSGWVEEFESSWVSRIKEGSTSMGLSRANSSVSSTGGVLMSSMSKALLVFRFWRVQQSKELYEVALWNEHQGVLVFVWLTWFWGWLGGNWVEYLEMVVWEGEALGLGCYWGVRPLGAIFLSIANALWKTLSYVGFSNKSTSLWNCINKPMIYLRMSTSSRSRMWSCRHSLQKKSM